MLNGAAALETAEFMAAHIDEFGTPDGLQPLRRRLGARDGHAVPVDEAGRLALGWHPQRHDRALAERHQGQGRDPQPVPPRHRRRADRARRGGPARADVRERRAADAARWREHGATRSTTPARAERHETQYFEMFVQPRHLPPGLDGGDPAQHAVGHGARCRRSTTTSGSCTRPDDWTQARDLAARAAREAARAAAAVPHRGEQVQRPAPRRPAASSGSTPTSPDGRTLVQRQRADAVRRHGPADRELACSTSRTSRTPSPRRSTSPTAARTA